MIFEQCQLEVLQEVREERGISIAALARKADIEESKLGKCLRGKRRLQIDEAMDIAAALGMSFMDFQMLALKKMVGRK